MMKRKLVNSLILAALAVPAVAMADTAPASPFSGNVSLVSDYLFRGVTQTDHRGAIQGGFDYVNPNGFYAGTWGSNISWLTDSGTYNAGAGLELDTYAGYSGSFATDYTYNVGFLRYNYSGEYTAGTVSANTNEVYGSIGWKWVSAKYSRSFTNLFGVPDSSGSGYLEVNGTYTLEGPAVDLSAHYGKQSLGGTGNSSLEYSDYNVKAAKAFGAYTWAFLVSKTNITGDSTRGVLSVSHSM
ncbi:MAG: TorF family putative porin [Gallionella sp.]